MPGVHLRLHRARIDAVDGGRSGLLPDRVSIDEEPLGAGAAVRDPRGVESLCGQNLLAT